MSIGHVLLCSIVALVGIVRDAGAETSPDSITLRHTPPKVGQTWTSNKRETTDLVVTTKGQKVKVTTEKVVVKKVEVLQVTKDVMSKGKYTYTTDSDKRIVGGVPKGGETAIHGKTYILTAGTPTDVVTEKGPAPAAEVQLVRKRVKRFGKPERMGPLLAGKTFIKDKPQPLPVKEIAETLDDPDLKITTMTMTFRGMKNGNAIFDIAMKAEGARNNARITMSATGKVVLDPKTGDEVETEFQGTVKLEGKETAEGTSTMTSRRTQ